MRAALLVGPHSGKGRGPAEADAFRALLPSAVTLQGGSRESALSQARTAVSAGLDVLVAAVGGDGTAHLALQAVAGTGTALAIVPTGTGNDLANGLGVPTSGAAAARAVLAGDITSVDAVRVADGWFACILGTGFDAAVNERANRMSWPRGRRRYDIATLLELRTFRPQPVTLVLDGERHERSVMLVALGNATSYGGGMRMCPGADLRDGLLDVVVVNPLPRRRLVALFPRLFKGTHVEDPSVEVFRARSVSLEGAPLAVYADGEAFGHLPLSCEVVPGSLRVVGARLA
ncbi:MAG: sphingosine kinase [Frankiales bacterium]|nr:sphingosine kinase [Frankiales bacterium]